MIVPCKMYFITLILVIPTFFKRSFKVIIFMLLIFTDFHFPNTAVYISVLLAIKSLKSHFTQDETDV